MSFENETPKTRFYMVYVHGAGAPRVQHVEYDSAHDEAVRLARKYPGQRVSVLASVGTCMAEDAPVRWEW